jgi:archaellum component FlaF (FlaF/FlaG flagellin family)
VTIEITDADQKRRRRIKLSTAILMSAAGVILSFGISYGAYKERFENLERTQANQADDIRDLRALAIAQDKTTAVVVSQLTEINRRLEGIERAVGVPERRNR